MSNVATVNKPIISSNSANERRGTKMKDYAVRFAEKFPLGSFNQPTSLSVNELDAWLEEVGMLVVPPEGTPKDSNEWLGHLQRRHHLLKDINKASTHPRMSSDYGLKPYVIVSRAGGVQVRAPQEEIVAGGVTKKVNTIIHTRRRQLRYLMESADWNLLPLHEKAMAEALDDDIQMFEESIQVHTVGLARKFDKLASKIEQATKNAANTNGGLTVFLAPPEAVEQGRDDARFSRLWENNDVE